MSSGAARVAAEWMARLRGGRATRDDHRAYRRWLAADPEHRAAAVSLERIWRALSALEDDPSVRSVLRRHRVESGR